MDNITKVLIVDDSALVRGILNSGLSQDPHIKVVGTAPDAFIARDKIVQLKPDVMTLDIEMPKMDGVEFLRRLLPQWPIPTIIVSSLTDRGAKITFEAMEAGAIDVVTKPSANLGQGLNEMMSHLIHLVKNAKEAKVRKQINRTKLKEKISNTKINKALETTTDKVIAIGASTGGTEAIKEVVTKLPVNCPGVVIVQHMPPGFTNQFAKSLNEKCAMEVKEAETGDRVMNGRILIAPGGKQMKVIRSGGIYEVVCKGEEKVSGHCPSVDVLMNSVSEYVGKNAIGVVLTGMGSDGAKGALAMKEKGAINIGQDEKTSVVFGMPKVAYELGGLKIQKPIEKIAEEIVKLIIK